MVADLEQHDEKASGPDWATATCTCKSAKGNNLCKHVLALLLARLDRQRAWRLASRSGPAVPPELAAEAAAAAAAGQAAGGAGPQPSAAPAATRALPPGSLATQGGKRKRVLPGALAAAAG